MIDNAISEYSLRDVIGQYMKTLGDKDDRVVIVNADLMGSCRNKSFVEAYPDRAFNVGIAEQNMVSFSAGLSHEGFKTYAFSMAPFISMRACEQVRTDVAYANLDVRLIAIYAGVSGGISGATHWSIEDVGIMCSIPNLVVLEASDPIQAERMLDASLEHKGPLYIRSSVVKVPKIYGEDYKYTIGKASVPVEGDDGAIICSGVCVNYAIEVSHRLKKEHGVNIMVVDMHTIKPIDRDAVISAAATGNIIVAQDHNVIGGLGSIVSSVLAEEKKAVNFKVLGITDEFVAMAHAPYLYDKYHIDAEGLYEEMIKMLGI